MTARALAAIILTAMAVVACAATPAPSLTDQSVLARRAWLPDSTPRAVILGVHGFNDYSNAFTEFGQFAAEHGIAVYAYDQRGFGANPAAGLWPGTPALIEDLELERARIAELHPERPVYVMGESMGAAVVIAAVTSGAALDATGFILTAPAVWGGDQLNPLYRATLWVAARLAPGLKLTGRSLGVMASDNLDALRALSADPLFIKETRVDAIAGLVELMDTAYAAAAAFPGPLLVLVGKHDEIVPPDAQTAMIERLTATPCLRVIYPEGWHLLLRDLQRRVVWQDILAWIDGEPVPSGQGSPCGTDAVPLTGAAPAVPPQPTAGG
jgi:alpha-beta hydrolase superfamily lysophospholipase